MALPLELDLFEVLILFIFHPSLTAGATQKDCPCEADDARPGLDAFSRIATRSGSLKRIQEMRPLTRIGLIRR